MIAETNRKAFFQEAINGLSLSTKKYNREKKRPRAID
jgi:hypothetical protein